MCPSAKTTTNRKSRPPAPDEPARRRNGANGHAESVITYSYTDERGVLISQKFRSADKQFWWGEKRSARSIGIYRWPEVSKAINAGQRIAVVEGEKDVENLWAIGVPATCSPHGAAQPGKEPNWCAEYSEMLRGADIVVMGDNDVAGRTHVAATASMSVGIAARVRTLNLAQHWPEIKEGYDVSDWLEAGHTCGQLNALMDQAPDWPVPAIDETADQEAAKKAKAEAADQELVDRLARLNQLDYEKQRKDAAEQQGIRRSALDDAVERRRAELAAEGGPAPLFGHWVVEPWPEPVDGSALLLSIIKRVRRHVIITGDEATAVAHWVLMAWVHSAAVHSPILLATSAEANSGKTTLINLIGFMVPRGMNCVGISEAALFRTIELHEPTVIVDEADVILVDNEPLRSVINCGWTRGSGVLRCVGDSNTPHLFPTFCPKALGMKGRKLPDTTLSRCIVIGLKRKKPLEQPEHFRYVDDAGLSELRGRCMRWAADTAEALKVAAPEMPAGFDNRLGDNWRLMFAIADHAGGEWPEKARRAAANVSKVVGAADMSTGARLLADIRRIFVEKGVDRMPSADLADALGAMEDRPWSEWKGGKPITKNGLAKLLKPFDVFPGGIRVGGDTPRGYYLAQFQDAFERYLQAET